MRRLVDQDRRREQRRQSLLLDRLEGRFRGRVSSEISRAMRDMVQMYEATGEVMPARDHHERMEGIYRQMYEATFQVFGGRILEQGKSAGLILERKEDFAQILARVALNFISSEAVRRRITSVTSTTRAQIVSQVDRGFRDGLGVAEIARDISKNINGISRLRGALIARTETHGAANAGADTAARETGLTLRKEWVAAADERTRDSHAAVDGETVGMDDAFSNGLMYPGDPSGDADEVINCRCAQSFVVDAD